jgi:hypothetical protein
MSTNSLHSSQNLKNTLFALPAGMPITTRQLEQLGISRQLVHRYVSSGWLEQLGYGYYLRHGDILTQTGAVTALEFQGVAVHIGGKAALSLHGVAHYLALGKEKLFLYGTSKNSLPAWFIRQFPTEVRGGRLFNEASELANRLHVKRLDKNDVHSPYVAEPERALLEMLDDVPQKQGIDEAKKIMEPMFTLRFDALQILLEACTKIKVKRLFFHLAEELSLPVLKQLNNSKIDFGALSFYILSKKGNSLVLKHPGKSAIE